MDFFQGRKLVIATKHHKESVLAPKAASRLGVLPFVAKDLDTDLLGTFSGEIARTLDPLAAARRKCELAMELTGADLALASEGSFGPHPAYYFIPGNEELVLLLDKKNGFEIAGRKLSTETNYDGLLCTSAAALLAFADKALFPSHALILRDRQDATDILFKGICDHEELLEKFHTLLRLYGQAFVETDMRAMYNPTRMQVIAEAMDVLLEKALFCCAQCGTPGFSITGIRPGLKCRQCKLPTQSAAAYIYSCSKCGFNKEQLNPARLFEEPKNCDYYNP